MKIEAMEFLPKARREAIITKQADGELLVYDLLSDRAHCLNETAAAVWKLCDGRHSVVMIAAELSQHCAMKPVPPAQAIRSVPPAVAMRSAPPAEAMRSVSPAQAMRSVPRPEATKSVPPAVAGGQSDARINKEARTNDELEQIVWLALDQLRRTHLLEAEAQETFWPAALSGLANMSRREAVRRIGLGTAIALPLVASMTAPRAVEAAVSCGAKCKTCSTPADCCNVCSSNVPGCPPGNRCT